MKHLFIIIYVCIINFTYSQKVYTHPIYHTDYPLVANMVSMPDSTLYYLQGSNRWTGEEIKVTKLDKYGNIIWTSILPIIGDKFHEHIYKAIGDNGVIISYLTYINPLPDFDGIQDEVLIHIDSNGVEQWRKKYESAGSTGDLVSIDNYYYLRLDTQYVSNVDNRLINNTPVVYKLNMDGSIHSKNIFIADSYAIVMPLRSMYLIGNNIYISTTKLYDDLDRFIFTEKGYILKIDTQLNLVNHLDIEFIPALRREIITDLFQLNNIDYAVLGNEFLYSYDFTNNSYSLLDTTFSCAYISNTADNGIIKLSKPINDTVIVSKYDYKFQLQWNKKLVADKYEAIEIEQTIDGGYVIQYLKIAGTDSGIAKISKTDCMLNHEYWSDECNSKLGNSNIILYPNPANNILNIECANIILKIEVINSLGEQVKHIETNPYILNNIDISNLVNGIHFLKISTKDGVFFEKFIKY
jgi:hypothetical protein